jgi:protein phosphatase
VTEWSGSLSKKDGWALIGDGLGGHVAGEIASALAIEVLRPTMSELKTEQDIQSAVNRADEALFMAMDMRPELRGMGTTIAGFILRPSGALAFNCGDTRAYSLERGVLRQLSVDDVSKRGQLLQCLGGFQEPVPLLVHTCPVGREATLVLCSDGLSNLVGDEQIAAILQVRPSNPALALVNAALAKGGHDNVTVIVIEPAA